MAKQVRETAAGKAIGAYIVLNKKGEHVATIQAHYSNGGTVRVDVWQTSLAIENCCNRPELWARLPGGEDYKVAAWNMWHFQQGKAGGYGYDKFTAALSGLIIDGHTLADHCGRVPEAEKARSALLKRYENAFSKAAGGAPLAVENASKAWDERAGKIGARFTNWSAGRYQSLHFEAGLGRLERLGYRVIQAI